MTNVPNWQYNEFRHIGVDFSDLEQVLTHDERQQSKLEAERALVKTLGIASGQVVVEFGCGTGTFALAAAETGAQVIAADVSQVMIAYASRQASKAGLNIQFVNAGFLTYQHTGAPAHFVVSKYALHHLPDFWKSVALARIYNLLGDGGKLYLEDVIYSFEVNDHAAAMAGWIEAMSRDDGSGFTRADFEMHIREEHSTFTWILEAMIERAGFRIETADISAPTYAKYRCVKE
jgi:putative AdoMet-dependent methyltransferase